MRSDAAVGSVATPPGPPRRGPSAAVPDVGAASRAARTAALDRWLAGLLPPAPGIALVALGGLGRRECLPYTDLDLVLVHADSARARNTGERVASQLWYRVWDANYALDHSVRTVGAALETARTDVRTALGLLDARVIAGDWTLAERLRLAAARQWRQRATESLTALRDSCEARWQIHGDLRSDAGADLKEARGGLRDVVALRGFAMAQVASVWRPEVRAAGRWLLDVREAAHHRARRRQERLHPAIQAGVAAALGHADEAGLRRAVTVAAAHVVAATGDAWKGLDRRITGARMMRLSNGDGAPALRR